MKLSNNGTGGLGLGTDSNYIMIGGASNNNTQIHYFGTGLTLTSISTLTANAWKSVLLEVNGNNITIKVDGNTYSVTGISANTELLWRIQCSSSNIRVRNLKIKPL